MSVGHLYVLSGEVAVQVLCPFFNWIVVSLVLSCVNSSYILHRSPLSEVSLVNMSPTQQLVSSLCGRFPLPCKTFLVWCHFICLSFVSLAWGDIEDKISLFKWTSEFLDLRWVHCSLTGLWLWRRECLGWMFELCLEVKVRCRFGYGRWETSFVPVVLPVLCLLVNIILVLALKSWASLWLLPGEMAQLGHHEAPGLGETGAAP